MSEVHVDWRMTPAEWDELRSELIPSQAPYVRRLQAEGKLGPVPCCELHGRNCEPPYELCCRACTEADHPEHRRRGPCSNPDLSTCKP